MGTGSYRGTWLLVAFVGAGCTAAAGDTGPAELPPEDTSGWREDTGTFPFDSTGDTAPIDEAPTHWLTMRQEGTWTLGGSASDPTSMTGTLLVTELLDADLLEPACLETWALVGTRAETDCDGCDYTFTVEHTRVTTEGECRTPELPESGDVRVLGSTGDEILWDWYDTGVWVPLWEAGPGTFSDEIDFEWEVIAGVTGDDEEE